MIYIPLAIVYLLLCLLPAMIAQEKGRSMFHWYLYALVLTPALILIAAFVMKKGEPMEKCRKCGKKISVIALECPHCGAEQMVRTVHVR